MSAIATKIVPTLPDPKRAFESAIAQIRDGATLNLSRTPIGVGRRAAAAPPSPQTIEKQAVTDAARALAALWHVSPNLVR